VQPAGHRQRIVLPHAAAHSGSALGRTPRTYRNAVALGPLPRTCPWKRTKDLRRRPLEARSADYPTLAALAARMADACSRALRCRCAPCCLWLARPTTPKRAPSVCDGSVTASADAATSWRGMRDGGLILRLRSGRVPPLARGWPVPRGTGMGDANGRTPPLADRLCSFRSGMRFTLRQHSEALRLLSLGRVAPSRTA